jgi:HAD superfamily hydrolase (TIGR01450 family)
VVSRPTPARQDDPVSWVLDLDGVVWLGDAPIAGAADALRELRAAGERVAFVTNNSYFRCEDVAAKLRRHGIDPGDDVLTSAMAAAALIEAGERVLVCGGPGVSEAVTLRDGLVVDGPPADVVVVGYNPSFDYDQMRLAATAVRRGARLLATNDDATYPTGDGPIPGAGSILASIVTASGTSPTVAGKPHEPMVDLVRAHAGSEGIVVGDRPDTDGRFARALGFRFGLVLTGVTHGSDLPVDPQPDVVADDLAALVEKEFVAR